MRYVSYADEHFLTSDEVASAMLRYAMYLARAGSSDVIRIPTTDDGGTVRWAELIIGPASQITTLEANHLEEVRLPDGEVLAEIKERMKTVADPRPVHGDPVEDHYPDDPLL